MKNQVIKNDLGFITWYEDDKLSIYFSTMPCVAVRYITPSNTNEERQSIKRFPFINKRELKVQLQDKKKGKVYNFAVPKGYCYDGASIPRIFWRLIGANTDNSFLIPALIHDVMCENHGYIDNDRSFSTEVFNALLYVEDVGRCKRFLMKNSVACFQTLFAGWKK